VDYAIAAVFASRRGYLCRDDGTRGSATRRIVGTWNAGAAAVRMTDWRVEG
jgi:hypothetical protein